MHALAADSADALEPQQTHHHLSRTQTGTLHRAK